VWRAQVSIVTSSLFDEAYVALEAGSEALWWYGTSIGSDLYGLL
jgi:hypothetical protein